MEHYFPSTITFQWHITEICNFRCRHCYQENFTDRGLPLTEQIKILDQFEDFVKKASLHHKKVKAHINFTGGEPFLREDFIDLLNEVSKRKIFSFGILSNGYLLPEPAFSELKKLKPKFIQISLEGNREINDNIRGQGSYNAILKSLRTYANHKIPVMVSFTANASNYKYFPDVVKTARKYKAFKVWTDRYLPVNGNDSLKMTPEQTKEYFNIILKEQQKQKYYLFSKLQVSSARALQFLVSGGVPYKCSAGNSLLAILPNGDLLPCRRLPVKTGNICSENLVELYQTNSFLKQLRYADSVDEECKKCYYKNSCNGGLRCLSFATTQNAFGKDPDCRM